jgi:hypothetical protein
LVLTAPQQTQLLARLTTGSTYPKATGAESSSTLLAPVIVLVDRGASDAAIIEKTLAALPASIRRNNPSGLRSDMLHALGLSPTTWTGR